MSHAVSIVEHMSYHDARFRARVSHETSATADVVRFWPQSSDQHEIRCRRGCMRNTWPKMRMMIAHMLYYRYRMRHAYATNSDIELSHGFHVSRHDSKARHGIARYRNLWHIYITRAISSCMACPHACEVSWKNSQALVGESRLRAVSACRTCMFS